MDRRLGAYVAFCIALVSGVAAYWGRGRLIGIEPRSPRAELVYGVAARGGPALAIVASLVCVALLFSLMRNRRER